MSTLAEKIDKQFTWQRTRHASSKDLMDLFVSVDDLAGYLATQTRGDRGATRRWVKEDLEYRASVGEIHRWAEICGASRRADRVDHYFINAEYIHPDS